MQLIINLLILVLGFFMLARGSDWFVEGSAGIAARFKIPSIIVGLTIVAMGTSLPEASVSIVSALKGSADISIGNVVGSNIMNILLILGITSVICPVPVEKATIKTDIPFMIFVTVVLAVFSATIFSISLIEGIIMWVIFIAYLFFLVKMALKSQSDSDEAEEPPTKERSLFILISFIILGAGFIIGGSNLTVNSATDIARLFGVSERIIGLTIIAFGTSLPELFTSCTAALKGQTDIAIGNIVGSNIFNILFVLGTSALVTVIPFSEAFIPDMAIAIISAVLLWVLCKWKNGLVRISGVIMLAAYAVYFVYLLRG